MKVKRTAHTPNTYMSALVRHGWKHVGMPSSFARVFTKGRTVIKVCHRPDFAYSAYVRKVMRWGARDPHFPRIYAAHRLLSTTNLVDNDNTRSAATFTVVMMELLECIDAQWMNIRDRYQISYGKWNAPTTRVARVIGRLLRNFDLDIHGGNVMRRPGTNQLVLVDPIYSFRNEPNRVRY